MTADQPQFWGTLVLSRLSIACRVWLIAAAVALPITGMTVFLLVTGVNHDIQFMGNSRFPPHGEEDPNILFRPFVAPLRKSGRLNEVFDGIGLTDLLRTSGPPDA